MSTLTEELARAKSSVDRWAAEIASGNVSVYTLNQLAGERGDLSALEILAMSWPSEDRRRASAERGIDEAKRKLQEPGAASIMAKAKIRIFTNYLSGDLTLA